MTRGSSGIKGHLAHFLNPSPKKIEKRHLEKKFLYFGKWNFLALLLKNFLYFLMFQESETPQKFFIFQETETLKSFLYFRKCNFLSPSPKNQKNARWKKFLIFTEIKPCTFPSKLEKQKKSTMRNFPTLQETETPRKLLVFFLKRKLFLYFRKRKPRKMLYISGNGHFLHFSR